jgi:DNA-binding FrmR family transcriptional regulator
MEDTDANLAKLEERIRVIEGRTRAIEALMLEMPGITQELIKVAKERVRDNVKGGTRRDRDFAALQEQLGAPLDEHAEGALDRLASALKHHNPQ